VPMAPMPPSLKQSPLQAAGSNVPLRWTGEL
jgi:hypothetical protein